MSEQFPIQPIGRFYAASQPVKRPKHDDSKPEHLGALLKTIKAHEEETGQKIDAQIVTWRGMMTKA
ncbi:hypothetical protein COL516b_009159 [Colletotrichum fioriniae]|nr:uncharacterized protein COL516b_009159 [Colletotrichum fioriniae]KAJ0299281.1 hypothetical protein COL516b_009159 [Colletotrichum fioriniae]